MQSYFIYFSSWAHAFLLTSRGNSLPLIFMKKILLSVTAVLLLCACNGGSGQSNSRLSFMIDAYAMEQASSFPEFARLAFDAVGSMPVDCSGDSTLYNQFYAAVDKKLKQFRNGHFVELRTVLYESAAVAYAKAGNDAELAAMRDLLEYCSAAVYIDGQRACDPPLAVRERYEQAKEKAMRQAN